MLDNIFCFACGRFAPVEVTRPAASSMEANNKARENNNCAYCGFTLELMAGLRAGLERMKESEKEWRKMQADRMGFEE